MRKGSCPFIQMLSRRAPCPRSISFMNKNSLIISRSILPFLLFYILNKLFYSWHQLTKKKMILVNQEGATLTEMRIPKIPLLVTPETGTFADPYFLIHPTRGFFHVPLVQRTKLCTHSLDALTLACLLLWLFISFWILFHPYLSSWHLTLYTAPLFPCLHWCCLVLLSHSWLYPFFLPELT